MGRRDLCHQSAPQRMEPNVRVAPSSVVGRGIPARPGRPAAAIRTPGRWTAWARERAGRGMRRDRRTRPALMIVTGLTSTAIGVAAVIRQSITSTGHLHLAIGRRSDIGPGRAGRVRAGESARRVVGRLGIPDRGEPSRSGTSGGEASFAARVSRGPERFLRREPPSPAREIRRAASPGRETDRGRIPGVGGRRREELVGRLVHGGRRVEVAPRPATLVQDRAFVPGGGGLAAATSASPGTTAIGGTSGAVRSVAAGTVAAVDLDQLTDQVVTRLDARLIAHRERFGRGI